MNGIFEKLYDMTAFSNIVASSFYRPSFTEIRHIASLV